jgi:hypothetical protein
MALGHSAIDSGVIVGSIADNGCQRTWDPVEQRFDLQDIIDVVGCQL